MRDEDWEALTPDALYGLATSRNVEVRRRVAQHPATPAEAVMLLISDHDLQVCLDAYKHENMPGSNLIAAAWSTNDILRAAVAANPDMPSAVLDRLVDDPRPDVRRHVASNWAASTTVLERLANDTSPSVRSMVARNPNTGPATLTRLAEDGEGEIRTYVARHAATPDDVKVALALRGHGPVDLVGSPEASGS